MTALVLNDAQLSTLKQLQSSGNYAGSYNYLRSVVNESLASSPANSVELQKISNWLSAAESINRNDKSFYSDMVRGSMRFAASADGRLLTDADFQYASDKLAFEVANDILSQGGIPDLQDIISADVQSAVDGLSLESWNWAGTLCDILPPPFGLDGDYVQIQGDSYSEYMKNLVESVLQNVAGLNRWLGIDEPIGAIFEWMWGDLGLDALGQALGGYAYDISSFVNESYINALNFIQRSDPLSLDLDNDGIETVSANSGIVFDFDGDGVKTGTGWLRQDDGFLVFDRNGNGAIDNGGELFGVDTTKADGSKARNGFDALRELDSNGDGTFNALDADFGKVRVWQDKNQDGASQASELKSLQDLGIAEIGLGSTAASQNSNGNTISATGTFTYTDGRTAQAANLDLASNPFYREYTDKIKLDETIAKLPNMQGSGAVRDLREAANGSPRLAELLSQYASLQTRSEQRAMLGQIVAAWADTANFARLFNRLESTKVGAMKVDFQYSWEQDGKVKLDGVGSSGSNSTTSGLSRDGENSSGPTTEQLAIKALLEKISILEVFNGVNFFNFQSTDPKPETDFSGEIRLGSGSNFSQTVAAPRGSGGGIAKDATIIVTEKNLTPNASQADLLNKAYNELLDSIYDSLLLQTRLKPYLDTVDLKFGNERLALDWSNVSVALERAHSLGPLAAIVDSVELSKKVGDAVAKAHWVSQAGAWVKKLSESQLTSLYQEIDVRLIKGLDTSQELSGSADIDFLYGEAGQDNLYGLGGDDYLNGGAGDDQLHGEAGNDTLEGGAGNDQLEGGDGDDLVDGGAGNDEYLGGRGNDTYLFGKGDGQDHLISVTYDPAADKLNTLQFKESVTPGEVILKQVYDSYWGGNALEVSLVGTTDKILLQGFFYNDTPNNPYNDVQQFKFADGTIWDLATIQNKLFAGTDDAESITGTSAANTLTGLAGADALYGRGGDDRLDGGAGDDKLYGEAGNDTLEGGAGNDQLEGGDGDDLVDGGAGNDEYLGGRGNDTYLFSRDDGKDSLYDYDTTASNQDVLSFDQSIAADQLWLRRSGSNLEVSIIGTSDSVTIQNWYSGSAYHVEQFKAADGKTLLDSQVQSLVDAMSAFSAPAVGQLNLPDNYKEQLSTVIAANWQ